ncbi:hypothetical protein C4546_05180 [Candidatus Parcubacteria bacterium]|jgi:hypothetical protein|nr:MAG: hypothetical protein C4546_05180 [Candidatus Parcubacteria bacterium]
MEENFFGGQARIPISHGGKDFKTALEILASTHIQSILNEPQLLATMSKAWLVKNFPNNPQAYACWQDAVEEQLRWLGYAVKMHLEEYVVLNPLKNQRLVIYVGLVKGQSKIFANFCPLCHKTRVCISRIAPKEFEQTHQFSQKRIFKFLTLPLQTCSHKIPMPDQLWQILENAIEILRNPSTTI